MSEMKEILCATCIHGHNKIVFSQTKDNNSECYGVNCAIMQPFTRRLRDKCNKYICCREVEE